jgi:ribosomal protein L3 glutamine methyltransferase
MESVEIWVRRCAARMDEAGLFFGHGTDNAWDEAVWLVLNVLGLPADEPFPPWGDPVPHEAAARIEALLTERIDSRRPLAYLLGEAWFCGLRFQAGPGALVPRSPFAELIARGFEPWLVEPPARALDLCTGGGCIGIAMAYRFEGLQVDAADISDAALEIAAANVRMHGLADRVRLVRSDLFENLRGRRYDLLVSNPPYVAEARLSALPEEYRAEPSLGLVLPLRILHDAVSALEPAGVLFCEVGESASVLQSALPNVPFTWIEFEHGGEGVFTMDRKELEAARPHVAAALEQRGHVV